MPRRNRYLGMPCSSTTTRRFGARHSISPLRSALPPVLSGHDFTGWSCRSRGSRSSSVDALGDEVGPDRVGALLGELLVVLRRAEPVGVAIDDDQGDRRERPSASADDLAVELRARVGVSAALLNSKSPVEVTEIDRGFLRRFGLRDRASRLGRGRGRSDRRRRRRRVSAAGFGQPARASRVRWRSLRAESRTRRRALRFSFHVALPLVFVFASWLGFKHSGYTAETSVF